MINTRQVRKKSLMRIKNKDIYATDVVVILLWFIASVVCLISIPSPINIYIVGVLTFIFIILLSSTFREGCGKWLIYLSKIIYKKNIKNTEEQKINTNILSIEENGDTQTISFLNNKEIIIMKIITDSNFNEINSSSLIKSFQELIESGDFQMYSYMSKWNLQETINNWQSQVLQNEIQRKMVQSKVNNLQDIQGKSHRIFVLGINKSESSSRTMKIVKQNYKTAKLTNEEIEELKQNFFNLNSECREGISSIEQNARIYKYFSISQFPTEASDLWLAKAFHSKNLPIFFKVSKMTEASKRFFFNNAIENERGSVVNKKNEYEKATHERNLEILDEAMKQSLTSSSLVDAKFVLRIEGSSEKEIRTILRSYRDSLEKGFRLDELENNQIECYKYITGANVEEEDFKKNEHGKLNSLVKFFVGLSKMFTMRIFERLGNKLLSESIAIGYPIIDEYFIEPMGDLIGYDEFNNPVLPNHQLLTEHRKAFNAIISGKNGMGKTAFILEQIKNNYLKGNIISFVPDYKKDYENLFKFLPKSLTIKPGSKGNNINLFDMYEESDSENVKEEKINLVTEVIKILTGWENELEISKIKNWVSRIFEVNKPSLTKFYKSLDNISKKDNKAIELKQILHSYVEGNEKRWFAEETDIRISDFKQVRFDLEEITQTSNNAKIAKAFNLIMLDWIKKELIKNGTRNKKAKENNVKEDIVYTMIYADEGHIISNDKDSSGLAFLNRIAKTARSYYGGVCFSTQNFSDIIKKDKEDASAIFNNATTWVFFGSGADDLRKLNEQFESIQKFTDEEISYLNEQKATQALYLTSGRRIKIRTVIDKELLKIINNGVQNG